MFKRKISIGVISPYNPKDKKAASGTNFKIIEALEKQGADIVWIKSSQNFLWRILEKILRRIYLLLSHKMLFFRFTLLGAYLESHTLNTCLMKQCDVIFASFSSPSCYKIKFPDTPLVYLTDATWHQLQNYYFFNFSDISIKDGDKVEKYILEKADVVIGASKWMIDSAVDYYHQKRDKFYQVHFGANMDEKDLLYKEFEYKDHLDLLFLGVDWIRKGGDIAVEATKWLNDNGVPSTLHVIGIDELPIKVSKLEYVDNIGRLDKNNPKEYELLVKEMSKCHLLLLPTIAECAGIAFCESCAMGLPSFTHATGGTTDYVIDGYTGRLFEIGTKGVDFGKQIKEEPPTGLLQIMSHNANIHYKDTLNWDVWGNKVSEIINTLI